MKTTKKNQKKNMLTSAPAHAATKRVAPTDSDILEAATVKVGLATREQGQGVLVPGNLILTAAHCVRWTGSGDMTLAEDAYVTVVTTPTGESFVLQVLAVEPASDIAVLGAPDYQTFTEDADLFEQWCERTLPVPLSYLQLGPGDSVEAFVLTHRHEWVAAEAARHGFGPPDGRIWVDYEQPILGGASGGPVVTPDGRLLGVVSQVNEVGEGPCNGTIPLARLALPRWVLAQIEEAARVQNDAKEEA